MRRPARALLLALLLFPLPASRFPRGDDFADAIASRIASDSTVRTGYAYWRIGAGKDSLFVHDNWTFHAASTMKVPVMVQLFRMIDAGTLSLDQQITLTNRFTSIADGSPYELDLADDSDSSLYAKIGQSVSVRDLIELMITRSSNLATNELITLAQPARITATMRSLGAAHIRVLRGVEDPPAYRAGLINTVTARDLGIVLAAIAQDRAASPASCVAMRKILRGQEFNSGIPAGVPPDIPVAHKTGWVDGLVRHDAAIVYPVSGGSPYVLVVLTGSQLPANEIDRFIAELSKLTWRHAVSGN